MVRKDLNEEERGQLKALTEEVKERNNRRVEAEKQDFYWNELKEEVVGASNVQAFKNRLDNSRYGGRPTRA